MFTFTPPHTYNAAVYGNRYTRVEHGSTNDARVTSGRTHTTKLGRTYCITFFAYSPPSRSLGSPTPTHADPASRGFGAGLRFNVGTQIYLKWQLLRRENRC